MSLMRRYKYQYTTADSQGEFTVDEYSESIANIEAWSEVRSRVNTSSLLSFDLVCVGVAS